MFLQSGKFSVFFQRGSLGIVFAMGGGMLDSFAEMIDKDGTVKFSISCEKGVLDILAKGCDFLGF